MDVVPPEWVAERLGDPDVRLVDVRDEWEFDGIGHLPGAVSVPFASFRSSEGDEGMLPGADVWADLLSEAGVDPGDDIVAYDDTHGVFAARFLVTAELYGHDPATLHLLDGDYSAWSRERETTSDDADPEPTDYETSEPGRSPLVGFEEVADAVDAAEAGEGVVVVDTREPEEYAAGHLPGAVQLDWLELVDADTRGLRPREELESVLEGRGITPDRRVVLYCNTARRISHTYTVLRHLGYDDLAFYEGSLTEWRERGGELRGDADADGADT
ncbi:sulfurtransferase [Candidatus Halobonum tyrrellensis]|uniref:Rhodanese-related sulfurtransferase n=1 Tax=Candidatus Halobonum tyrrellensis G22 TaxID=1324957 RepID=V4HJ44_9EURY|nr:rhodanese-like domain-containing protein [Candidatus Halobonum tyrrellensis]ESP87939.1 rhodanese-related sulfurtransferase [Candidatus Halobonum tyrrellensis G22]